MKIKNAFNILKIKEYCLEGLVKVEAEVGEYHPELLPAVAVLELAEQVAGQLVLQRPLLSSKYK
jgi:hypothetical protein